jgi:hypothetical protein
MVKSHRRPRPLDNSYLGIEEHVLAARGEHLCMGVAVLAEWPGSQRDFIGRATSGLKGQHEPVEISFRSGIV